MCEIISELKVILLAKKDSQCYRDAFNYLENQTDTKTIIQKSGSLISEQLLKQLGGANANLTAAELLHSLPNLFLSPHTSREFQQLIRFFLEASDGSLSYKLQESDYPLESYLNESLLESNAAPLPVQSFIISYILHSHYGERGSRISKDAVAAANAAIEAVLSDISSPSKAKFNLIPTPISPALCALHSLLHSLKTEERLEGRQICERFRVPIDLAMMLSLSVDGVSYDGKSDAHDIVLVIGESGSGKSTTINYLNGVQYELVRHRTTRKTYLEHMPDGVQPLARVGHGNVSRTLYPQVYRGEHVSFSDTPGFNDTRLVPEGPCASMGPALAVHHANNIRAVLITIEWSTLEEGRGTKFRNVCSTLNETIKNINALYEKELCPIIFAITKPSEAIFDFGESFNPDIAREVFKSRIEEFDSENSERYAEIESLSEKLMKSRNKIETIKFYRIELEIAYMAFLENQAAKQHQFGATAYKMLVAATSDSPIQKDAEKIMNLLSSMPRYQGLPNELVKSLSVYLLSVLSSKNPMFALEEMSAKWIIEESQLQNSYETEKLELEQLNGERTILKMLKQRQDNIFIIRGYIRNPNDFDHKKDLLEYIKKLKSTNIYIPRTQFVFNGKDNKYRAISNWARQSSDKYNYWLSGMFHCELELSGLREEIQSIKNSRRLERNELGKLFQPDSHSYLQELENTIADRVYKRDSLIKKLEENRSKKNKILGELKAIEEKEAIDYTSQCNVWYAGWYDIGLNSWEYSFKAQTAVVEDEPSILSAPIDFISKKLFGNKENKDIIPIDRVEISCLLNKESNQVVFNSEILSDELVNCETLNSLACHRSTETVAVLGHERITQLIAPKNQEKLEETGYFSRPIADLEKGDFSISYHMRNRFFSFKTVYAAGVRIFVKPIHIPVYINKMQALNAEIEVLEVEDTQLSADIEKIEKQLVSDYKLKSLLKSGLLDAAREEARLERIISIVTSLGPLGLNLIKAKLDFAEPRILLCIKLFKEISLKYTTDFLQEAVARAGIQLRLNFSNTNFGMVLLNAISEKIKVRSYSEKIEKFMRDVSDRLLCILREKAPEECQNHYNLYNEYLSREKNLPVAVLREFSWLADSVSMLKLERLLACSDEQIKRVYGMEKRFFSACLGEDWLTDKEQEVMSEDELVSISSTIAKSRIETLPEASQSLGLTIRTLTTLFTKIDKWDKMTESKNSPFEGRYEPQLVDKRNLLSCYLSLYFKCQKSINSAQKQMHTLKMVIDVMGLKEVSQLIAQFCKNRSMLESYSMIEATKEILLIAEQALNDDMIKDAINVLDIETSARKIELLIDQTLSSQDKYLDRRHNLALELNLDDMLSAYERENLKLSPLKGPIYQTFQQDFDCGPGEDGLRDSIILGYLLPAALTNESFKEKYDNLFECDNDWSMTEVKKFLNNVVVHPDFFNLVIFSAFCKNAYKPIQEVPSHIAEGMENFLNIKINIYENKLDAPDSYAPDEIHIFYTEEQHYHCYVPCIDKTLNERLNGKSLSNSGIDTESSSSHVSLSCYSPIQMGKLSISRDSSVSPKSGQSIFFQSSTAPDGMAHSKATNIKLFPDIEVDINETMDSLIASLENTNLIEVSDEGEQAMRR